MSSDAVVIPGAAVEGKDRQIAQGLPLGAFDRLELDGPQGRVVAQLEADRALFVRVSRVPVEGEAASFGA